VEEYAKVWIGLLPSEEAMFAVCDVIVAGRDLGHWALLLAAIVWVPSAGGFLVARHLRRALRRD